MGAISFDGCSGENGERKCVAARSVDSSANRRLITWSKVLSTSISDRTLLWCEGLWVPAMSCDLTMSGEYAVVHVWFWHVKSRSIACALSRETKFVILSPSDCFKVKNCWRMYNPDGNSFDVFHQLLLACVVQVGS